jgi:antitoxin HicB
MKQIGIVYPAKLRRQGRSVLVRFPDLPEALTEGRDEHDALVQAADCLEEAIAGRILRGEVIPVPCARGRRAARCPCLRPWLPTRP